MVEKYCSCAAEVATAWWGKELSWDKSAAKPDKKEV